MDHEPHDVLESDAEFHERLGLLSAYELGLLEAQRRDEAERAAEWQRSVAEYEATKRARSEPGAVVSIEGPTVRVTRDPD